MKIGLETYTSYEVAALRLAIAGIVLLPLIKWRQIKIAKADYKYFVFSGIGGSAIPAFLFTEAQTKIASSLAGALNGLTPLFALLFGIFFLGVSFNRNKLIGALIGLGGAFVLMMSTGVNFEIQGTLLIILATLFYGINVNVVKHKLGHYPPLLVAALPLAMISIIGIAVLLLGNFHFNLQNKETITSLGAIVILAVIGTGLSLILFNKLIQKTNTVFATSVTYLIPIVALFWGIIDGESISVNHILGLGLILLAIWLIRKDK
jgi:drug/metabolite transporter (DMT)-like permease